VGLYFIEQSLLLMQMGHQELMVQTIPGLTGQLMQVTPEIGGE